MTSNAVAETTAAHGEYPVLIDRSFLYDKDIHFEDRVEVAVSDFIMWYTHDFNNAQSPNVDANLYEEDEEITHFEILDEMYQTQVIERADVLYDEYGDPIETPIMSSEDMGTLFAGSLRYWLARLNGRVSADSSTSDLLVTADLLDSQIETDRRSIFHTGANRMKAPEFELASLFNDARNFSREDPIYRFEKRALEPGAKDVVDSYKDEYEIRNHQNTIDVNDICPEQEIILLSAILPLLYVLEKEYSNPSQEFSYDHMCVAAEAMFVYAELAYNFPDLRLRLIDVGNAILYPSAHSTFMAATMAQFNESDDLDALYQTDYMSIPPYEIRNQTMEYITRLLLDDPEFKEKRYMTLEVMDENGDMQTFRLSLHSGRFLVDSNKGAYLAREFGLPKKEGGETARSAPAVDLIRPKTIFDETTLEELSVDADEFALNILDREGLGEIKDGEVIPRGDDQHKNITLPEFLRRFKIQSRDFSGIRFEIKDGEGGQISSLSRTVSLRLYAEIHDRFSTFGINLMGISKFFGRSHGYAVWEAIHSPATADFGRIPEEERMIKYYTPTGQVLHVAPMVHNGVFEIQFAHGSPLSRIPKQSEQRKRGKTAIVVPMTKDMPYHEVLSSIDPFYIPLGRAPEGLNFPETLGRALGVILHEKKVTRLPDEIYPKAFFAASLFLTSARFFGNNAEWHSQLLDRNVVHSLPLTHDATVTREQFVRHIFKLIPYVRDKSAKEGLSKFALMHANTMRPKVVEEIVRTNESSFRECLRLLLIDRRGENRYFKSQEPLRLSESIEGLLSLISHESLENSYIIRAARREYGRTPELELVADRADLHEYKMLMDMTLFVLSVIKPEISTEKIAYTEDEEMFSVRSSFFSYTDLSTPLRKAIRLLLEGDCTMDDFVSAISIAYVILNADFYEDDMFRRYGEDRILLRQGIESFRRNPLNFLSSSSGTYQNMKFGNLRRWLAPEILEEYSRLWD